MSFPSNYETFDISTSSNPLVTIHGRRSPASDPHKPPLLLLHGFPQTHHIYHKVAPHLQEHHQLILPDLRGYGASSTPTTEPYDPTNHSLYAKSAMASDMSTLMRKLGHHSYFVCAHDRGARVAHKLAVDHPDEVTAMILLDICPTAAMYGNSSRAFATAYWHWYFLIQPSPFPEELIVGNPGLFAQKQLGRLNSAAASGKRDAKTEIFGEEAWRICEESLGRQQNVHAMCEDYRASAQEDLLEQEEDEKAHRRVKCKTRVLWGKSGVCEKLFDTRAEWKKVVERDMLDEEGSQALECGHYIPEEKPEELVKHVLEFLK